MMNFCMKSSHVQKDELIFDGMRCNLNEDNFENPDQLQQNCSKINLPTSVIRSSSLNKISHSCSKSNQKDKKIIDLNQSGKKIINKPLKQNEMTNQKNKKNIESSTKQVIFNKLLQKNTKASTKINNKQNHNQKQKIIILPNSFYHKHQNLDKIAKLYQEKTEKELQQCTFNPKINAQNSSRNHDIKQFYKHQIEHSQRTFEKIQQMREIIKSQKQKQNTFKPNLTQQTIELTHRRANHNVYERLYQKKNQQQEQKYQEPRQFDSFRRQTSKKSISLISSNKKGNQSYQCKQKNSNKCAQNKSSLLQKKSLGLKSQKSLKKFQEMVQMNHFFNEEPKNRESNYQYSNSKKTQNFSRQHNLDIKKKSIEYGIQKLDCQPLFKHLKQLKNPLSRQQSCKLLPSSSSNKIQTSKSKYDQKQWTRNKDGISMKNKTSQKTIKIALEKFTKQIFVVSSKIGLTSMLDINQMINLLKNLNFIENTQQFLDSPSNSELKIKVFQIWTILEGTQSGFILFGNFLKILCAIQGFTNASMIQEVIEKISKHLNQQQFFQSKQMKSLILSEKDSKTIKNDFMNFYLTRLKLGESKLYARELKKDHFTFHPSVSKQSQQYAGKYREKIIQESQKLIDEGLIDFNVPEDGFIDHSTLLILDQKIKDYKKEGKRLQHERQRIKKQNQSMQSHSISNRSMNETYLTQKHKRSLNKYEQEIDNNNFSKFFHNDSQQRQKNKIFTELYEQGRKSKSNRRDKSTEQVQYESNKDQLTFKPKINQRKVVSQFKQNGDLFEGIPHFTNSVMRMRSKNKIQKDQLSISPLLYLNVTIQGNSQTKIPVFQKDTFQEIVEKVRVIMKIQNGQQQKTKLQNILKQQIIPVLNQLGIYEKQGRFFSGK